MRGPVRCRAAVPHYHECFPRVIRRNGGTGHGLRAHAAAYLLKQCDAYDETNAKTASDGA